MKIVHINATYGVGSTGQIVRDLHESALCAGQESYAYWATAAKTNKETRNVYRIGNVFDHKLHALLRRLGGLQGDYSRNSTVRFCKKLRKLNPDVVHLHNLHSNYINVPILLNHLANMQVDVVITLHDCWFLTGYCTHYLPYKCQNWQQNCVNCPAMSTNWKKHQVQKRKACLQEAFARMKRVKLIGVSPWITEVGSKAIQGDRITAECIYNWVDTDIFQPIDCSARIKQEYKIPPHHKIVLGVAQGWSKEKGIIEFLRIAEKFVKSVTVLLVGDRLNAPDRENVRYLGHKKQQDLVELYSSADVFVNPSRMETFGLVTVEAMACGTPVVCYDNTSFKFIVPKQCGIVVHDGDISAMISATEKILDIDKENFSELCRNCSTTKFSKQLQISKYLEYYTL